MATRTKHGAQPTLAATESLGAAAEEAAAEAVAVAPPMRESAPLPARANGEDPLAALMESQAAVARGVAAISVEMAGMARSGFDTASRTATDLLAVKTLSEAIGLSTGFARRSFEEMVAGSAKLSEIGLRIASEASQPFLAHFGRDWPHPAR
jgi:hypothetical protein